MECCEVGAVMGRFQGRPKGPFSKLPNHVISVVLLVSLS